MVDFSTSYRVSVSIAGKCKVLLGEKMEEMKMLKYLGTVLWKHGDGRKNKKEL